MLANKKFNVLLKETPKYSTKVNKNLSKASEDQHKDSEKPLVQQHLKWIELHQNQEAWVEK